MGASLGDVEVLGGAIGDRVVFDASEDWKPLKFKKQDGTWSYQSYVFYKENGDGLEISGGIIDSIAYWSLILALPSKYLNRNWKIDSDQSSIYMPWGGGYGGNSRPQLTYSQEKGGIIMGSTDSAAFGQYQYVIVFHLVLVPVG